MATDLTTFGVDEEDTHTGRLAFLMSHQGYIFQDRGNSSLFLLSQPGRRGLEDLAPGMNHFVDNTNLHRLPTLCTGALVAYCEHGFKPIQAIYSKYGRGPELENWDLCVTIFHNLRKTLLCKCRIEGSFIFVLSDEVISHSSTDSFQLRFLNLINQSTIASDGSFECSIHGPDIPVPYQSFDDRLMSLYKGACSDASEKIIESTDPSSHFGKGHLCGSARPIRPILSQDSSHVYDIWKTEAVDIINQVTNHPHQVLVKRYKAGVNVSTSRVNAVSYSTSCASIFEHASMRDDDGDESDAGSGVSDLSSELYPRRTDCKTFRSMQKDLSLLNPNIHIQAKRAL